MRVIVTGGGSGIGRAAALLCAREGALVTVLGRRIDPLRHVAATMRGHAVAVDVGDAKRVAEAVAEAAGSMSGIDAVINCAGVLDTTPIDELGVDLWDAVLRTNLTGPFLVSQAALPYLRSSAAPAIVNVAALAAITPGVASVAYSAAKAGVVQLSRTMAAQLAPHIRVNAVCPGAVDTAMTRAFLDERSEAQGAAFVARYACNRLVEPDEIAALLVFLISPDASCITGSNYVADGGRAYH